MRQILIRYRQINTSSNSYYEKTLATGDVKCIDDETPFDIPQNWEWCRMKDVFRFINGRAYKKDELQSNGKYKVLRVGNFFTNNEWYYSDLELPSEKYCNRGDLLYAWSASFGPQIWEGDKTIFHYHIWNVDYSKKNLFREYLFYFLLFDKTQVLKSTTGSTMIHVSMENMNPRLIPIPPLEEQKRIASRIETLLPLIDIYEGQKHALDLINNSIAGNLYKSILQEAIQGRLVPQIESEGTAEELLEEIRTEKKRLVKEGKLKKSAIANESRIFRGDDNKYYTINNGNMVEVDEIPFDIPNSWSWVRLGEIFDHNTGKALNGKGSGNLLRKYLTTSNLYWDYFDFSTIKEMYFSDSEIEKCTITKGDLLVCEGGDVGRAAIWSYDYDMCIQNHIHRLRAYLPICTRFFYYVLRYYKHIGLIGGKGIGIQGLSSKALHDIIIPLPTVSEQERITSYLDFVLASIMSR